MKTNYQAIRFGGRCLSSTFFLCFTLLSANAFGEAPNPDKMAQVDLQAPAQLAPIVNLGDLDNTPFTDGDGFQGDALEGNNTSNPDAWDYWRFCATEGDEITIETHRTTSAMDPTQQICEGTAADTTGIVAFSSCGPDMGFVASADVNNGIPHGVGGAFADPISVFIAPSTGEYTLAVWDFLGASTGLPTVPYEIHLDGVTPCNPLSKEIVFGTDLNGDLVPDLAVEVGIQTASMYDFKLTYDGDDPVLIEDTVPAEWDVVIAPAGEYSTSLMLDNGGFESGDFTSWSQINGGSGGIVIDDGTFDPPGPGGTVVPFDGSYGSVTFQGGPGVHTLYRDVDVPPVAAHLSWADHIENWAGDFSIPNQQWRVEVWDPSDNTVLAILRQTLPGDPLLQGWTVYTADLSPWAGQTVRLAFTEQDNLSFFNARLDAVEVFNDDTNMLNCVLRSANGKDNGKSATLAECLPEAEGMTWFWAEARCHDNRNNTKCRPTSCGALYLNDGAEAYEEWDFDSKKGFPEGIGDPSAVSNNLCLTAVEDVNGDGVIDYTGNGDEDGDGLSDHAEACDIGTDPCLEDTDGDGVPDGADECPLEGPADPAAGEILEPNGCIRQSQCSDGIDNDDDTFVDFPTDAGCDDILDDIEEGACLDAFSCSDPDADLIECGNGGDCACFQNVDGPSVCVDATTPCAGLTECVDGNDCGSDEACVPASCCGVQVCVNTSICNDPTAQAVNYSFEGQGPTLGQQ